MSNIKELLNAFHGVSDCHCGSIPWSVSFAGLQHDRHVLFSGIVHGNETGSLPSLVRLAMSLSDGSVKYGGRVTIVLGNVPACQVNKRFLEADLNRVFTEPSLQTAEGNRAQEMMRVIRAADLFIDFHQTIAPTERPFFVFPYNPTCYQWARIAGGPKTLVMRHPTFVLPKGEVAADQFARSCRIPAITLELGQCGLSTLAKEFTWNACIRILSAMDSIANGETLATLVNDIDEPDLELFEIQYSHLFESPSDKLNRGYQEFSFVESGVELGESFGQPLVAPFSGYLIFPRYPERNANGDVTGPIPGELFSLARRVTHDPNSMEID